MATPLIPVVRPILAPAQFEPVLKAQQIFVWLNPPSSLVKGFAQALRKLEGQQAQQALTELLSLVWWKDAAGDRWQPQEITMALDALTVEEGARLISMSAGLIDDYWMKQN